MKNGFVCTIAALVTAALLAPAAPAAAQEVMRITGGKVGINNSAPTYPLDLTGNLRVRRTDGVTSNIRFQVSGGAVNQTWLFQNNANNGGFEIRDVTGGASPFKIQAGAPANLFTLTAAGTIEVKGGVVHSDFVFEPDYALQPIEEHAAYMWENKHLPAVGKGEYSEDGRASWDLLQHNMSMLEELEVAHIYIAQLNEELQRASRQNEELAQRLERLERLVAGQ